MIRIKTALSEILELPEIFIMAMLIILAMLSGCAKKVQLPINEIKGVGFIAVEGPAGHFVIAARDEVQYQALETVCTKEYICAHAAIGVVIEVERTKKK